MENNEEYYGMASQSLSLNLLRIFSISFRDSLPCLSSSWLQSSLWFDDGAKEKENLNNFDFFTVNLKIV